MWKGMTIDRMLEHRIYSNTKAKKILGFTPKYNIKTGLKATLAHLKQSKRISIWPVSPVALISTSFLILTLALMFYL